MAKASSPAKSSGASPGGRTSASQEHEGKVPRLPHERDESSDSQPDADPTAQNRAKGRQAHEDTRRGVRDTTRGEQADETYRRLAGGKR